MIDLEHLTYYKDAANTRLSQGRDEGVKVHPSDLLELIELYMDRIY